MLLQARGRLTAAALADEFEVSVRTIYRDIDHLSAAGVPVYADSGPGGGYKLIDGYRTRLTGLTQAEAEALNFAALPELAEELGLARLAASARMKLFAALPPEKTAGALRIADRFHLDLFDWYQGRESVGHLRALADCVWCDRQARITYDSWTGCSTRTIDPFALVLKGGKWYCVARSGDHVGIYKIVKIEALVPLDSKFTRPQHFNLTAFWSRETHRFEKNLRNSTARVRLHRRALSKLHRLGADAVAAAAAADNCPGDWLEFELPTETVEYAAHDLLTLGTDVVVLEPAILRQRLGALASRIASTYAQPS